MKITLKLSNGWLESTWYTEEVSVNEETHEETVNKTQVHCESFSGHPEHIAMLRAKAIEYDTELDEALIKECIANFKMPTDEELLVEANKAKVQEAKQYLQATDHKFYLGYKPKEGEDLSTIEAKRDEAREYIRMNEVA